MIKIDHLTKNYGNFCAVDDISFEIEEGEIVGLLGPNGAGKSTTMNILTGFLSATGGNVEINGINVLDEPLEAKKLIGYLPEQPPLYTDMTVEEYLNFTYDLKRCTLDRKKHIKEICDTVKISDVYKRIIGHLSKGYRQRVGIAQALIGNPSVIIFDEPTVGLDPKQIIEIRNLIRTLGKNHTVILSTHILQEVQAVCDRIIIVNKGKLVADELTGNITHAVQTNRRFTAKICGPAREVFAELKSMQGVVGVEQLAERDGDATAFMIESAVGVDIRKTLFYTLSSKSWPLIGLEAQGMNLEDVFISIVDTTGSAQKQPINKRRSTRRESAEDTVAKSIVARTASQKADASKENKEVK